MSTKTRMGPRPKCDDWKSNENLPLMHKVMSMTGILPPAADSVPRAKVGQKVPALRVWNQLLFPLPLAVLPTVLRYYYYYNVDKELPSATTTWFLLGFYKVFVGLLIVRYLNNLVSKYGYLDGGIGRDTVPFNLLPKVALEVFSASFARPGLVVLACYNPKEPPSLTWWLPVQLFVLTLMEDFTYYWFHRMCHVADSCWALHRLHHTTKHPTSLLLGYADELQEFVDIVGAPIVSWLVCPFPFDVTLIWVFMQMFVQLGGHSGIRLHFGSIMTGPVLTPLGLDLVVEDHDLHHRHGWKDSYNYGKASRLWDSLYGTTGDRIECYDENLDWSGSSLKA